MAYDTDLADRIRELLGTVRGVDKTPEIGQATSTLRR